MPLTMKEKQAVTKQWVIPGTQYLFRVLWFASWSLFLEDSSRYSLGSRDKRRGSTWSACSCVLPKGIDVCWITRKEILPVIDFC